MPYYTHLPATADQETHIISIKGQCRIFNGYDENDFFHCFTFWVSGCCWRGCRARENRCTASSMPTMSHSTREFCKESPAEPMSMTNSASRVECHIDILVPGAGRLSSKMPTQTRKIAVMTSPHSAAICKYVLCASIGSSLNS